MNEILKSLFEIVILPILGILTTYAVFLIRTKINKLKAQSENELFNKYLTMLNETIADCVLATTQTYVDSLKKQDSFDMGAQKVAFTTTYTNVMKILSEEAIKYLQESLGDLNAYINNRIEAEVLLNK